MDRGQRRRRRARGWSINEKSDSRHPEYILASAVASECAVAHSDATADAKKSRVLVPGRCTAWNEHARLADKENHESSVLERQIRRTGRDGARPRDFESARRDCEDHIDRD